MEQVHQGHSHFCDGSINAEKYIKILEQHMLPLKHLFQGLSCILQEETSKPHPAHIAKAEEEIKYCQ